MSSRDLILERVRRHQPPGTALPEVPAFDRPPVSDAWAAFSAALARMGGEVLAVQPDDTLPKLVARVAQQHPGAGIVCSAAPEFRGTRDLAAVQRPHELADVDIGVVRARFGVVETGSVWLSEAELQVNALAYLAQHLVVLLDPAALVPDLHHAYARPEFARARYAVLMTGPSATADIEGVLIRGAQGVRSFTVIPWPGA